MKLAELVFIPYPGISHLQSTVKIAKLLVDRDDRLFITVLVIKLQALTSLNAQTDDVVVSTGSERIKFIELPPYNEGHPGKFRSVLLERRKSHVRDIVAELVRSRASRADSPHLAGLVIDMFCVTMIDVANEFGIPTYVFYTSGAGFLGLMFHLQHLHDQNNVNPTELQNDPDAELVVPCFVDPVPTSSLPYAAVAEGWSSLFIQYTRRMREIKGIIVNSFVDLESFVVSSMLHSRLPSLYLVGPVLSLKDDPDRCKASSGESDTDNIMKWLNDQLPLSVVSLCFGTMGFFRVDQLNEIACALEQCEHRFLWSVRKPPPTDKSVIYSMPSDYSDLMDALPEGFLDRTAKRGRVIGWAPQVDIMAHQAIGGFVSHCGWNSILESIWFGVPIATWPIYAEQHLNAFQMVKELGVAEAISLDFKSGFYIESERSVLEAREIEGGIRRLMEHGNGIRSRAREMSKRSREAVMEGGSSYSSLGRLINDVMDNIP
ncbi:anthocyanidin 3-O-glucosyltransferase 2-like [Humulus lupulus]|uniref:anthocyanidin 3-O-glucosyltransferase 2-like n=1 Tax=Humulus lupulus TaxID=3486 RepID=UPI002B40194A|nr:anthocyanidin 3-O-glucosyltransferase 2-like [Humulus lupulus]